MYARDIPIAGVQQEEPVLSHKGHFQGKQVVLLTRTLEGEQKDRNVDTTFAPSPVEQVAQTQPALTFYATGPVGMAGGQAIKPAVAT